MGDGISIRRSRPSDRNAVRRFHRSLYLTHRDAVMPPGLEPLYAYRDFEDVLDDDVAAMLADRDTIVLLAEVDGAEAGYITGRIEIDPRRVCSKKGIVGDWYVATDQRSRGVGRALLSALEAIFAEEGCAIVESATWPFNDATRRLHERLGFTEVQIVYRRKLEKP